MSGSIKAAVSAMWNIYIALQTVLIYVYSTICIAIETCCVLTAFYNSRFVVEAAEEPSVYCTDLCFGSSSRTVTLARHTVVSHALRAAPSSIIHHQYSSRDMLNIANNKLVGSYIKHQHAQLMKSCITYPQREGGSIPTVGLVATIALVYNSLVFVHVL